MHANILLSKSNFEMIWKHYSNLFRINFYPLQFTSFVINDANLYNFSRIACQINGGSPIWIYSVIYQFGLFISFTPSNCNLKSSIQIKIETTMYHKFKFTSLILLQLLLLIFLAFKLILIINFLLFFVKMMLFLLISTNFNYTIANTYFLLLHNLHNISLLIIHNILITIPIYITIT